MRDKGNLRTRGPRGLDSIVLGYYRGKELVYVARVSNTDIGGFKNYIKKYGAFQITEAIRPEVKAHSQGDLHQ